VKQKQYKLRRKFAKLSNVLETSWLSSEWRDARLYSRRKWTAL